MKKSDNREDSPLKPHMILRVVCELGTDDTKMNEVTWQCEFLGIPWGTFCAMKRLLTCFNITIQYIKAKDLIT